MTAQAAFRFIHSGQTGATHGKTHGDVFSRLRRRVYLVDREMIRQKSTP